MTGQVSVYSTGALNSFMVEPGNGIQLVYPLSFIYGEGNGSNDQMVCDILCSDLLFSFIDGRDTGR